MITYLKNIQTFGATLCDYCTLPCLPLSIFLLAFSQSISAEQTEIDHTRYTGKRTCLKSNDTTYCSDRNFGGIYLYKGKAYCGAGKCLSKGGNVYCSQYPGGDIIRNNGALWTGPGQCVIFRGNVRCAKEPMGICIEKNGNIRCQGGWIKELPVKARHCERSEMFGLGYVPVPHRYPQKN